MRKISYILTALVAILNFCSCEEEFEVNVTDRPSRMYVQCLAGTQDSTSIRIAKAVPVGAKKEYGDNFTIKKMSITQDGTPLSIIEGGDKTRWYTKDKLKPGSKLEFKLETEEVEAVSATTIIPRMPSYTVKRDTIQEYLQYTIDFDDTVTENSKLGAAIMCTYTYEDYDTGEPFTSRYSVYLTKIEEEASLFSELTDAFKTTYLDYEQSYAQTAFFLGKELEEGNVLKIATNLSYDSEYELILFAFSDEAFGYLNAEYQKDSNILATLGLAPASFAYTNIAGGYGVFAGISAEKAE